MSGGSGEGSRAGRVGLAVLGLGRLGARHAATVARLPGARLAALADPSPIRVREMGERYGAAFFTDSLEVIASPAVDGVVIAAPTPVHADLIEAAARAGKPVFCEKPLGMTLAECDRIIRVLEETGTPFQLGFMRRFDPGYAAAKARIEAGEIGEVRAYVGFSRDPGSPPEDYIAESGGIYIDMLIHEFDLLLWLTGAGATSVYARGRDVAHGFHAPHGDADHAYAVIDLDNGGLACVEGSRCAFYGYDIRAEILGTKGALQVGYLQQTPLTLLTRAGGSHDLVPHFPERFATAFEQELAAFAESVRTGKAPAVGALDGRRAQVLALAATRSHRLGRPVSIGEAVSIGEVE
jgi:scyllo-inositol 2-dehydrogenase (NAD+)